MSKDNPQTGIVIGGVTISSAARDGTLSPELFNIVASSRFVEQVSEIAGRPQIMDKELLARFNRFFNSPDTNQFAQFYYSESPVRVLDAGKSAGHSFIYLNRRYFNEADAKEVINYLGGDKSDVRLAVAEDTSSGKLPADAIALRVPDTIFRDKLIVPMYLQNGERIADRYPEVAKLANEGFSGPAFDAAHTRLAADGLKLGAISEGELRGFTVNPIDPAAPDAARNSGVVQIREGGKAMAHGEQVVQTASGEFALNSENVRRMEASRDVLIDGKSVPLSDKDIAGIRAAMDMSSPAAAIPQGRPQSPDQSQQR